MPSTETLSTAPPEGGVSPAKWPDALPKPEEEHIASIVCGNSHLHWAFHSGLGDALSPALFWRYEIVGLLASDPAIGRSRCAGVDGGCAESAFAPVCSRFHVWSVGRTVHKGCGKSGQSTRGSSPTSLLDLDHKWGPVGPIATAVVVCAVQAVEIVRRRLFQQSPGAI
eukprot:scaffold174073_cov53-Attheya_sp.AAC.1